MSRTVAAVSHASRGFAQLSLRRLSREELKRWLETVFHQGDIGTELPTFLHRYTEGNPLLVAQVLRALVDDGGVWYAGTRWEWRALDQMQLPPACAQLVGRRIERLSPRAATIIAMRRDPRSRVRCGPARGRWRGRAGRRRRRAG